MFTFFVWINFKCDFLSFNEDKEEKLFAKKKSASRTKKNYSKKKIRSKKKCALKNKNLFKNKKHNNTRRVYWIALGLFWTCLAEIVDNSFLIILGQLLGRKSHLGRFCKQNSILILILIQTLIAHTKNDPPGCQLDRSSIIRGHIYLLQTLIAQIL